MSSDPYRTLTFELRKLSNAFPDAEQLPSLFDNLDRLDAQSAAIIAASAVEVMLRLAIQTSLTSLSTDEYSYLFLDGPFKELGQKIHICYALGIIGRETKRLLQVVQLVRNAFAHHWDKIEFDTDQINNACIHLLEPTKAYQDYLPKDLDLTRAIDARSRYMATCMAIAVAIARWLRLSGEGGQASLP